MHSVGTRRWQLDLWVQIRGPWLVPPDPGLSWQQRSDLRWLEAHQGQISKPGVVVGTSGEVGLRVPSECRGVVGNLGSGLLPPSLLQ